jgi:hypothetical protein
VSTPPLLEEESILANKHTPYISLKVRNSGILWLAKRTTEARDVEKTIIPLLQNQNWYLFSSRNELITQDL